MQESVQLTANLYGHEELLRYTYCDKYCFNKHGLRKLCHYLIFIFYPFITFYLVFYLLYFTVHIDCT